MPFRLFPPANDPASPGTPPQAARRYKLALRILAVALAVSALAVMVVRANVNADLLLVAVSLLSFGGLMVYDVTRRRAFEKDMAGKLRDLARSLNQVALETARNREDLAKLKKQVAQQKVEAQKPPQAPAATPIRFRDLALAHPPQDSGAEYSDTIIEELLQHALQHNQLSVFAQPIVKLPQRRPVAFEMYARLKARSDRFIPASRYLSLARQKNLTPEIDNLLLLHCLDILKRNTDAEKENARHAPFFINVSRTSLYDSVFMTDLTAFVNSHAHMAPRLVFEMSQRDIAGIRKSHLSLIRGLARLGCQFSMDQVDDPALDIPHLKNLRIGYVKMDAGWLKNETGTMTGLRNVRRMKSMLSHAGIKLVADKIETEQTLRDLLDLNVDYGQGYLFGKPGLSPSLAARKDIVNG